MINYKLKSYKKEKLGLGKLSVSNLQNLHTIKGGNGSDLSACIRCVDTSIYTENQEECNDTAGCETQGGYACGETQRLNCQIETNLGSPC